MIAYQIIDRFEFDCILQLDRVWLICHSLQLVNSILIAILYSNLETYDYCVFDSDHVKPSLKSLHSKVATKDQNK